MPSPDDIAHLALDMMGESLTANLLDETADGRKLKRGYDVQLAAVLGSYPWRFARKRLQIATVVVAPESDVWAYAYELPSDCLQPLRINEDDREKWQREGDFIVTNVPAPLLLEYTALVANPGLWPGAFITAFITLLASTYAGTFKHDFEIMKALRNLYYTADLPEAKTQDARARGIEEIRVPTLTTDVRSF